MTCSVSGDCYMYDLEVGIGSGAQGTVFPAQRVSSTTLERPINEHVAIKHLRLTSCWAIKYAKREIMNHSKLNHNCIVTFQDLLYDQQQPGIYIVMDLMDECLQSAIDRKELPGNETTNLEMFQDLISAVDYCHKRGVSQRDIKPQNILIRWTIDMTAEGKKVKLPKLKLADFGLSKEFLKEAAFSKVGTWEYLAPEVFEGPFAPPQIYNAQAVDVFSCGLVLFQLLFPTTVSHYTLQVQRAVGLLMRQGHDEATARWCVCKKAAASWCGWVPNQPARPFPVAPLDTSSTLPTTSTPITMSRPPSSATSSTCTTAASSPTLVIEPSPPEFHKYPEACLQLLHNMLQPEPAYRATISDVLSNDWFGKERGMKIAVENNQKVESQVGVSNEVWNPWLEKYLGTRCLEEPMCAKCAGGT